MNKSGSSSFLPTYNLKNQYAALPSGTPSYSSNGNVNNDGFHSYYWDSEGKNVKLDANVTMTYDALGRWVERNNNGVYSQAVYAPDGSEAAVMRGSTIIAFYVHMPMGAVAVYGSTGALNTYWHPDWMGTPRLDSSPTRTVQADLAFGAYGEQYQGPVVDAMFTAVAQVPEANDLRTFPARNLETLEGRWMSPDPAGLGAVDITNPQSFNRYAYVLGNPLGNVDPTGTVTCPDGTEASACVSADGPSPIQTAPIQTGFLIDSYTGEGPTFYATAYFHPVGRIATNDVPLLFVGLRGVAVPPKTGAQKLACAAKFGNDHSIGALFGGGKVAMFFGGNTVSSLTNLGLAVTGNGPAPQYPGAIALSGPALGLPVNDALRFAGKQGIPQLTSASGFVRSQALQTVFKAATGPSSLITTLGGEAALQGGITAGEYASGVALAKFAYDVGSFAYGYFFACGD